MAFQSSQLNTNAPNVSQELFDDYLKSSGFPLSLLCFDSFWLLPDRIFRGRDKPGNRICSFFGISHEIEHRNVQVLEKETRLCSASAYFGLQYLTEVSQRARK